MHFEDLVDVLNTGAGACRNALAARGVEQRRLGALFLGHGGDNGFLTLEHFVVEAGRVHRLLGFLSAGQHAHNAAKPAHTLHLAELLGHVIEIKLTLGHFLGHAFSFFGVHLLAGFFDQRNNVALPQYAPRKALGVKRVEPVKLFANTEEFDRQTRHRPHGQSGTAAPVAIHSGEHEACELQPLIKALGRFDRILSGQRIGDEKGLGRIGNGGDLCGLAHHLFVKRGPARGVEDKDIMPANLGRFDRAAGNISWQLAIDNR